MDKQELKKEIKKLVDHYASTIDKYGNLETVTIQYNVIDKQGYILCDYVTQKGDDL